MSSATLKTSANLSLAVALPHAIAFLTTPLLHLLSHTQLEILHVALLASLTDRFRKSWTTWDPKRGSGSRCLTLSPCSAPPKPIFDACVTASLLWTTWIQALGNVEINLFVDPGCVSVAKAGIRTIIWELPAPAPAPAPTPAPAPALSSSSSISDDEEDIFISIQEEVFNAPYEHKSISQNWQVALEAERKVAHQTSTAAAFATLPRLDTKAISRSSSRTSMHSASSSVSSISSFLSTPSSASSATSVSSTLGGIAYAPTSRKAVAPPAPIAPRHKRAAQVPSAAIYVNKTKGVVQKYDMGKTTVLTGGTMLGCAKNF